MSKSCSVQWNNQLTNWTTQPLAPSPSWQTSELLQLRSAHYKCRIGDVGSQDLSHLAYLNDDRWNDETDKKKHIIEKGWERTSSSATLSFLNIAAVAILKLQMKLSAPHQSPNFPSSRGTNPTTTVVSSNLPPLKDKPSECAAKANGVMMSCKKIQKTSWSRQTSNEGGISTGTTRRSSDRKSKYWFVSLNSQIFSDSLSIAVIIHQAEMSSHVGKISPNFSKSPFPVFCEVLSIPLPFTQTHELYCKSVTLWQAYYVITLCAANCRYQELEANGLWGIE